MKQEAKKFIQAELLKREIKYPQLAIKMEHKGYHYSANTIRTKIHRGSFSFSFLLEVCDSLDIDIICLDKNKL